MGLFDAAKGLIFGSTSSDDERMHEERAGDVSQDFDRVKQAHRGGDDLHTIFSTVVRLLALTLTMLPYVQVRSDLFALKGDLCLELAVATALRKEDDDKKAIEGWIEEGGQAYESWNKSTPCEPASKLHAATRTIGARVLQHTVAAYTHAGADPLKAIDEADSALRCLTGCSVLQQELIVLNNKAKATAYTTLAAQSANANDEQHYHAAAIEAIKRCVQVAQVVGTDGRLIDFFLRHMTPQPPTTTPLHLPTDTTAEILCLAPTFQTLLHTHTPSHTLSEKHTESPAASPVRVRVDCGSGGSGSGAAAGLLEAAGGGSGAGATDESQGVTQPAGRGGNGGGVDDEDDTNGAPAPVAAPPAAAHADDLLDHHDHNNSTHIGSHNNTGSSSSNHRIPMDLTKPSITTAHKNRGCWSWGFLRIGNLFSACMDSKCEDDGDDGTEATTNSSNFSSPRSTSTPTPTHIEPHAAITNNTTTNIKTTAAKGDASHREFSLLDAMGAIQIVGEARGLFGKGGEHNATHALKLVEQAIAVLDRSHTHAQLIHPAARLRSAILDAMDHHHQLQEQQAMDHHRQLQEPQQQQV